jgi:hypothetical protein
LIGLVVIVALSVGAYFLSPKGENQTYVFHCYSSSTQGFLPGWWDHKEKKLTEWTDQDMAKQPDPQLR